MKRTGPPFNIETLVDYYDRVIPVLTRAQPRTVRMREARGRDLEGCPPAIVSEQAPKARKNLSPRRKPWEFG